MELVFISAMICFALFLLFFSLVTLAFTIVYGIKRKAEPVPLRRLSGDELPCVTVQLPIRNEGAISQCIIRSAAALDYPADRLQVQILDDSNDATSAIIDHTIADLRRQRPELDLAVVRRGSQEGFKAGALRQGTAVAKGEFFAVFDADFVIPPDFLDKTIHFFADPAVGTVQARWAYMNRHRSTFTAFQATKLDAHQMFDQTARARTGLWVHFHGTAGVLRRRMLDDVGGWNCISEVEDIELSIRAHLKGWTTIYLDRLRVPSELPETVSGFLTQQLRWKRGWIRVLKHYGPDICRGPVPLVQRLDILARLVNAFGSAVSLPFTIGALPTFLLAERLGLWWLVFLVYVLLLTVALLQRIAEARFIDDLQGSGSPATLRYWVHALLPVGLILNMGMTPAWTLGTFEGFGRTQRWEVTPKGGALAALPSNEAFRVPSHIWVTVATAIVAAGFLAASLWTGHLLAGLFYVLMLTGCAWIAGAYLREYRDRRAPACAEATLVAAVSSRGSPNIGTSGDSRLEATRPRD